MFWENFFVSCASKNKKPLQVVKDVSVATGNITKWKNGTIPNGETLIKLADYFDCSVDYLLGRTDSAAGENFSTKEKEILSAIRNLSSEQQELIISIANSFKKE